MKKRGPIVIIAGAVLIGIAFLISYSVMEGAGSALPGNGLLPSPESMFDETSEKETIFPGMTYTFSHTTSASHVPLMWGLYVTDYKPSDKVSISVSDISGDNLGSYDDADPILIKSFMIPKLDTYSFAVENTGSDSITAEMLFTENPEKSKALTDPNSPFNKNIVPLAAAGFMLIFGIIVIIAGIVLGVLDWRKSRNQSRYI
ncbi:MAG TPA: hypothetical protein VJ792_02970 [Candidatus Nitrosotalea sp.]|nr:hypothetical protein [Candidatus Nitrosotalea sp.]